MIWRKIVATGLRVYSPSVHICLTVLRPGTSIARHYLGSYPRALTLKPVPVPVPHSNLHLMTPGLDVACDNTSFSQRSTSRVSSPFNVQHSSVQQRSTHDGWRLSNIVWGFCLCRFCLLDQSSAQRLNTSYRTIPDQQAKDVTAVLLARCTSGRPPPLHPCEILSVAITR